MAGAWSPSRPPLPSSTHRSEQRVNDSMFDGRAAGARRRAPTTGRRYLLPAVEPFRGCAPGCRGQPAALAGLRPPPLAVSAPRHRRRRAPRRSAATSDGRATRGRCRDRPRDLGLVGVGLGGLAEQCGDLPDEPGRRRLAAAVLDGADEQPATCPRAGDQEQPPLVGGATTPRGRCQRPRGRFRRRSTRAPVDRMEPARGRNEGHRPSSTPGTRPRPIRAPTAAWAEQIVTASSRTACARECVGRPRRRCARRRR